MEPKPKPKSKSKPKPGIVQIWDRETGSLMPRAFTHRIWASKDVVLRLGIHKKLEKHRGCVNTVGFNANGDILMSGSDDRMIILWDWNMGIVKSTFHSGHRNNVFDANFVPFSDDRRIVTCAADGEVRYAQMQDNGQVNTKKLVKHKGRAYRLVFEPGNPNVFYSCGEDGVVNHFDLRSESTRPFFTCNSFPNGINPLNAITIHPRNPHLIAVAGADEFARLYDIRRYKWDGSSDKSFLFDCFCPKDLIGEGQPGITGLAFSEQCELLASYCEDQIYLFTMNQGLGTDPVSKSQVAASDSEVGCSGTDNDSSSPLSEHPNPTSGIQAYVGHRNSETMKGVSFFGPNSEYVVSGSDCGRIFIWRKKDGELLRVMKGDTHIVNCIQSHPHGPIIASSGIENDIKVWIPNITEPAPPLDMKEVLMADRIACFGDSDFESDDDYDEYDNYDDVDDDNVDIDGDDDGDDNNDDDDDDDDDDSSDCDDGDDDMIFS